MEGKTEVQAETDAIRVQAKDTPDHTQGNQKKQMNNLGKTHLKETNKFTNG